MRPSEQHVNVTLSHQYYTKRWWWLYVLSSYRVRSVKTAIFILSRAAINFAKAYEIIKKANRKKG